MALSIRRKVLLELGRLPTGDALTSTQLASTLGVRVSSLSSILHRMEKRGEIVRIPNFGPKGGYGYRYRSLPSHTAIRTFLA